MGKKVVLKNLAGMLVEIKEKSGTLVNNLKFVGDAG
jgi:hypothetical protein